MAKKKLDVLVPLVYVAALAAALLIGDEAGVGGVAVIGGVAVAAYYVAIRKG